MKRSELDTIANLKGIQNQMIALGAWRQFGVTVTEDEARGLFTRFVMDEDITEAVTCFITAALKPYPWDEATAREMDEMVNRVMTFVFLARGHALANLNTTVREVYGPNPRRDSNAIF